MSAYAKIPAKLAREWLAAQDNIGASSHLRARFLDAVRAALETNNRKKQKRSPSLKLKSEKKRTKKEKRAEVREAVMARAAGRCEHCGRVVALYFDGLQLDHFLGRARSETVETCWALCDSCHRSKTRNFPSAETWLRAFIAHCDKHRLGEGARLASRRLAFVQVRSSLPSAPAAPGGGRP